MKGFIVFAVILALLPLGRGIGVTETYIAALLLVFVMGTLAQSWNFVGGYAGYIAFGNTIFFAAGGYTVAVMWNSYGITPLTMIFPGGLLAAVLAYGIGKSVLRLRGPYFAIITLALSFAAQQVVINTRSVTLSGRGISAIKDPNIPIELATTFFYYAFLALLLITTVIAIRIENSRFGYGLVAIRENEDAALASGIKAPKLKLQAFVLSGFFTGLAGGLYTPFLTYISPLTAFAIIFIITPIIMTLLGGRGTWLGPLIGAFILEPLRQFLVLVLLPGSSVHEIVFGALMIILILTIPAGLVGYLRERSLMRLASRQTSE